jgi:hypothetical protein
VDLDPSSISPHRREHDVEAGRFRHDRRVACAGGGNALIVQQQAEQIFDVVCADDVIEVFVVDRIARVRRLADDGSELGGAGAERNSDDPHARHHHFARGTVAELEQLLQHLARVLAERPLLLRFLHDELQFFRRVVLISGLRLAPDADGLEDRVPRGVQHDDERIEDRLNPEHRRRDVQRHPLC